MILIAGLALELASVLPMGFARSGGVATFFVLWYYYRLENKEFLTGRAGNLFDSDNHYLPKKVLSRPYIGSLLLGTAVWIFGDLVSPLLECGRLKC